MKFKAFFLFFNGIIAAFLLAILFMPMVGGGFVSPWDRSLWMSLWPIAAVLATTLIILDIYYFFNRKLFRLLEREDWPALSAYLETRFMRRGRYPAQLTRLFVNTCLVMSDSRSVLDLENRLMLVRPALVERNALVFGVAHILAKDFGGALRFFAARDRGDLAKRPRQWIAWYHGFSMLLEKQFLNAAEKFRFLAREARDPVVAALAAWFLADNLSRATSFLEEAAAARERVRGVLKARKDWERELARTENEIYTAIVRRYINDAGNWIYQT
ncbi:MAG: hypothetical protein LBO76_03845 [Treponema sp.]|nr:hypothetical protein [Treponema sp.]